MIFINNFIKGKYCDITNKLMLCYNSLLGKINIQEEIDKNEGSIVNIASDNIIDAYDIVTLEYDISKAGLHQLTKTFAHYYQKAKINTLCFGWLDTPMNDFPENIKKEIPFVPLNKAVKETIKLLETEENGILKVVKK